MNRGLIAGAALVSLLCGSAQAEVGKASAGPGEWFLGLSGGGGASWGPERQAFIKQDGAPPDTKEVDFDAGAFYFLGLEAGYVLAEPTSLLDRIELSAELRGQSRSLAREPGTLFWLLNGDEGSTAIARSAPDMVVDGNDSTTDLELRLSLKNMLVGDDSHFVFVSLEPFARFQDTDGDVKTDSILDPFNPSTRRESIEAEYYGAQLAVEVERPVSDSLSLIGRASAGAYYVTADTEIEVAIVGSDPFGSIFEDSASTWGGRFGAAAGVKIPLHYAGASLTILGTVDYMTDVATIDHVDVEEAQAGKFTEAGFDDVLEVGGKVGLVFPLR